MTGAAAVIPVLLAIAGGVVYHLAAKSVPRDLTPTLVLIVVYAVALMVSALAHLWLPSAPARAPVARFLNPGIVGVGVGAAMIELGYILTYRAAWPISTASAVVNGTVAALLVPLGLAVFREHLSIGRVAGLVLCLVGIWLLRY